MTVLSLGARILTVARTRNVVFDGEQIAILSAEDLAVCKVLFNRPKDWIDLRDMLRIQADAMDAGYIGSWMHEMVGPTDERTRRFDELMTLNSETSRPSTRLSRSIRDGGAGHE